MRRCWFGAAALVGLLVLGLFSTGWMRYHSETITGNLDRAAAAAEAGDWNQASELVTRAQKHWNSGKFLGAILSDHAPMDQIETQMALLENARARRDTAAVRDLCTRITQALKAMAQSQQLTWENLL